MTATRSGDFMKNELSSAVKAGGITFMISGFLFAVTFVLLSFIPQLPSGAPGIAEWLTKWRIFNALSNEFIFLAAILLIPGIYSIFSKFFKRHPIKTIVGCSLVSMSSMTLVFLVIVQGRLCYPVFGIRIPAAMAEYVVSIYWGGMHTVFLLTAVAVILIGLCFREFRHFRLLLTFSLITAVAIIVGAYPWLIGTRLALLTQFAFSLWFIVTGGRVGFVSISTPDGSQPDRG